jgi:phosphatidylethanolamine-binding protein (PEBP) family uncharacterized protein
VKQICCLLIATSLLFSFLATIPDHYHFQVFALDTTLKLDSGFNRHQLLKAIKGHVLAKGETTGTFQRQ